MLNQMKPDVLFVLPFSTPVVLSYLLYVPNSPDETWYTVPTPVNPNETLCT